jgi:4-hydroxythreonine-4-phosphate dehydrogenase
MTRPTLAITVGDVAGIGPEIVLKALTHSSIYERCRPLVIGDETALRTALRLVERDIVLRTVNGPEEAEFVHGTIDVLQPGHELTDIQPGKLSAQAGAAAVEYVRAAATLAKARAADAIVTAPLNKAAMHAAGLTYPGHTELLAELFGATDYSLVLTAEQRFVFHVTTHVSLRSAIENVTHDRVLSVVELASRFAHQQGRGEEPIVVAGLNPHAGENGIFGDEEIEIINPALETARKRGINVIGPLPADAMWPEAVRGPHRFLVAMYHDQGHAPFKSVYGDKGVNITVGLPVIRTSVDHGTAFDIAGKGVARELSMLEAIGLAADLAASPTTS